MELPSSLSSKINNVINWCWGSGKRRAATVLVIGGAIALPWVTRPQPKVVPPVLGPRPVTALGRLTPEGGLVTLATPAGTSGGTEVVREWLVREGDSIRQGQLLGTLSSWPQLQASAALTQAQLKLSEQKFQQIAAGSRKGERIQAKSNLQAEEALLPYLEISAQKARSLFNLGAISEEELGKAEAQLSQARQKIRALQGSVIDTTTVRPVDLEVAASEVRNADLSSRLADLQRRNAEIRSPLTGKLLRIYSWPGMKETDQGLAVVARTGRMQVWAQVYQSDVGRLRIGQAATVTAESGGFNGSIPAVLATVVGEVSSRDLFAINANNNVNARVVLVKLDLPRERSEELSRLSGLNVTVRFGKDNR